MILTTPNLGLDPITAITSAAKVLDFLGDTFGGPSAAQIAAQQAAAAAEQRQRLYVTLGLVGGAAVLVAVLLRR